MSYHQHPQKFMLTDTTDCHLVPILTAPSIFKSTMENFMQGIPNSYLDVVLVRAVGSILKPVRPFSSVGMTLNLIIEDVVFLV